MTCKAYQKYCAIFGPPSIYSKDVYTYMQTKIDFQKLEHYRQTERQT